MDQINLDCDSTTTLGACWIHLLLSKIEKKEKEKKKVHSGEDFKSGFIVVQNET